MGKSDIEIARDAEMRPIVELAAEWAGFASSDLEPYGHYKAKLSFDSIANLAERPDGKLILVTAISPTPAGEGKTTTTVGLGDGLNAIGKKTMICLREPSLGPCFGMKGGAAGGGYAQVVPMEDINLHFTGDLHAIGLAHNLLAALLDNHIKQGNTLDIDPTRIVFRRVVDLNDRALRHVVIGLGGTANGFPREDGYDIVVASEVMAILCLSESLKDLRERLGAILVGYTRKRQPIYARDLEANGAMTVLLKDALKPNLVQTLEHTPAFVHGGPFANIAHGCNSVIATKTALKLADYVVTEAGFGADLGAEKFLDIKCRKAGLEPSAAVVVATIRALKYHGGVDRQDLTAENVEAVRAGMPNLRRHISNLQTQFGLPVVVAVNRFNCDTQAEIAALREELSDLDVRVSLAEHWEKGSAGATDLAEAVLAAIDGNTSTFRTLYTDDQPLWTKIQAVAQKIYGASDIDADAKVRKKIARFQESGYGHYPVCIAKTQYSFSTNAKLRGAPSDHIVPIRDVRLAAGAEFLVVICGDIMTMPGLPKVPAATSIDIDENGEVVGLF
jgi:formate--tetrahydrofolate ligase